MDDDTLRRRVLDLLAKRYPHKLAEHVASDLGSIGNIKIERVRNWIYKGTKLSGLDLYLLMRKYNFVHDWVMSAGRKWNCQICHESSLGIPEMDDDTLRRNVLDLLGKRYPRKLAEHVASDLGSVGNIKIERVRNWLYKGTKLSGFDLYLLMRRYNFIRNYFAYRKGNSNILSS